MILEAWLSGSLPGNLHRDGGLDFVNNFGGTGFGQKQCCQILIKSSFEFRSSKSKAGSAILFSIFVLPTSPVCTRQSTVLCWKLLQQRSVIDLFEKRIYSWDSANDTAKDRLLICLGREVTVDRFEKPKFVLNWNSIFYCLMLNLWMVLFFPHLLNGFETVA